VEQLTHSEAFFQPGSFSPNKEFAYIETHPDSGRDIYVASLTGDRKGRPWLNERFDETVPRFSPDGQWIAYVSNESGRFEVYVRPYPGPGGKWQVSIGGGEQPRWNPNGQELFYRVGEKMMSVSIQTKPLFSAGAPRLVFQGRYEKLPGPGTHYGITPDGQQFIMIKPGNAEPAASEINVVLNWFEELKQRVPISPR
jgi:serine/threonine-protein kinase